MLKKKDVCTKKRCTVIAEYRDSVWMKERVTNLNKKRVNLINGLEENRNYRVNAHG